MVDVDDHTVLSEWQSFKQNISSLKMLILRAAWKEVEKNWPGIFKNLLKIVKVVLVSNASSVQNERIFSKMNFIKDHKVKIMPEELYYRVLLSS